MLINNTYSLCPCCNESSYSVLIAIITSVFIIFLLSKLMKLNSIKSVSDKIVNSNLFKNSIIWMISKIIIAGFVIFIIILAFNSSFRSYIFSIIHFYLSSIVANKFDEYR